MQRWRLWEYIVQRANVRDQRLLVGFVGVNICELLESFGLFEKFIYFFFIL